MFDYVFGTLFITYIRSCVIGIVGWIQLEILGVSSGSW